MNRICKQSHINAVRQALDNGWHEVVVFEDDAWPCLGCPEKMEEAIGEALMLNADVIKLGAFNTRYLYRCNNTKWCLWGNGIGSGT